MDLAAAVRSIHAQRLTWGIDPEAFLHFAQSRSATCIDDLHLAYGAMTGSELATSALAARVTALTLSHKRARVSDDTLQEARQRLLERLLLARDGAPPKIATYAGTGPLDGWLRVSLAREALALEEQTKRETPWEELLAPPTSGDDQDAYEKALYKHEYKAAFERAANTLSARDRSILRQHLLLGLSIDRLGELYSVHRVTASRWVIAAKEQLMDQMRANLVQELRLPPEELEKIAGLIQSRLDFSLERVLRSRSIVR